MSTYDDIILSIGSANLSTLSTECTGSSKDEAKKEEETHHDFHFRDKSSYFKPQDTHLYVKPQCVSVATIPESSSPIESGMHGLRVAISMQYFCYGIRSNIRVIARKRGYRALLKLEPDGVLLRDMNFFTPEQGNPMLGCVTQEGELLIWNLYINEGSEEIGVRWYVRTVGACIERFCWGENGTGIAVSSPNVVLVRFENLLNLQHNSTTLPSTKFEHVVQVDSLGIMGTLLASHKSQVNDFVLWQDLAITAGSDGMVHISNISPPYNFTFPDEFPTLIRFAPYAEKSVIRAFPICQELDNLLLLTMREHSGEQNYRVQISLWHVSLDNVDVPPNLQQDFYIEGGSVNFKPSEGGLSIAPNQAGTHVIIADSTTGLMYMLHFNPEGTDFSPLGYFDFLRPYALSYPIKSFVVLDLQNGLEVMAMQSKPVQVYTLYTKNATDQIVRVMNQDTDQNNCLLDIGLSKNSLKQEKSLPIGVLSKEFHSTLNNQDNRKVTKEESTSDYLSALLDLKKTRTANEENYVYSTQQIKGPSPVFPPPGVGIDHSSAALSLHDFILDDDKKSNSSENAFPSPKTFTDRLVMKAQSIYENNEREATAVQPGVCAASKTRFSPSNAMEFALNRDRDRPSSSPFPPGTYNVSTPTSIPDSPEKVEFGKSRQILFAGNSTTTNSISDTIVTPRNLQEEESIDKQDVVPFPTSAKYCMNSITSIPKNYNKEKLDLGLILPPAPISSGNHRFLNSPLVQESMQREELQGEKPSIFTSFSAGILNAESEKSSSAASSTDLTGIPRYNRKTVADQLRINSSVPASIPMSGLYVSESYQKSRLDRGQKRVSENISIDSSHSAQFVPKNTTKAESYQDANKQEYSILTSAPVPNPPSNPATSHASSNALRGEFSFLRFPYPQKSDYIPLMNANVNPVQPQPAKSDTPPPNLAENSPNNSRPTPFNTPVDGMKEVEEGKYRDVSRSETAVPQAIGKDRSREMRDFFEESNLLAIISSEVSEAVKKEVNSTMMPMVAKVVTHSLTQGLKPRLDALTSQIAKLVLEEHKKSALRTSEEIQKALTSASTDAASSASKTLVEPLSLEIRNSFRSQFLPQLEGGMQRAFGQMHSALEKGLKSAPLLGIEMGTNVNDVRKEMASIHVTVHKLSEQIAALTSAVDNLSKIVAKPSAAPPSVPPPVMSIQQAKQEIQQCLVENRFEDALRKAMDISDPQLLVNVCKRLDSASIPSTLSQITLLSLLHQLSLDLTFEVPLKLAWLQNCAATLNPKDERIFPQSYDVLLDLKRAVEQIAPLVGAQRGPSATMIRTLLLIISSHIASLSNF